MLRLMKITERSKWGFTQSPEVAHENVICDIGFLNIVENGVWYIAH